MNDKPCAEVLKRACVLKKAGGKKKKETPSSSTNREKARNKPIMMIMGSKGVKGKRKQSLREKQQRLRAHIEKAKKSYH